MPKAFGIAAAIAVAAGSGGDGSYGVAVASASSARGPYEDLEAANAALIAGGGVGTTDWSGTGTVDAALRVSFRQHGADWNQGNCASRRLQSPINLNELYVPPVNEFLFKYREIRDEPLVVTNDGQRLLVDVAQMGLGSITLPHAMAPEYELQRIDVHSPSEHTLRGEHLSLEVQLVHAPPASSPGNQIVTISLLFNSTRAVQREELYPGLLQEQHSEGRQKRRLRSSHTAFLQGGSAEGEGSGARASSGAGGLQGRNLPGGLAADGSYWAPQRMDWGYNQNLQMLTRHQPPVFLSQTNTRVPYQEPVQLGAWLENGTFSMYRGSETLPPCDERVVWLVRREPILASYSQIDALFYRLNATSLGYGNYRTVMPINMRPVEVWTPRVREPPLPPKPPSASADVARDAITVAKAAMDYAHGTEMRLAEAQRAQARAWDEAAVTTPAPSSTMFPLPTRPTVPPPPVMDNVWAARQIANVVTKAIQNAVNADLKEVVPAATNLATGYLRTRLLRSSGMGPPLRIKPFAPPATSAPAPAPTPFSSAPAPSAGQAIANAMAAGGLSAPATSLGKQVLFQFSIRNMDYSTFLAATATVQVNLLTALSGVLETMLGGAIPQLSFMSGSIIVAARVPVPPGQTPEAFSQMINDRWPTMGVAIQAALGTFPGVVALCVGGTPVVSDFFPAVIQDPGAKVLWRTPIPQAPAAAGAWSGMMPGAFSFPSSFPISSPSSSPISAPAPAPTLSSSPASAPATVHLPANIGEALKDIFNAPASGANTSAAPGNTTPAASPGNTTLVASKVYGTLPAPPDYTAPIGSGPYADNSPWATLAVAANLTASAAAAARHTVDLAEASFGYSPEANSTVALAVAAAEKAVAAAAAAEEGLEKVVAAMIDSQAAMDAGGDSAAILVAASRMPNITAAANISANLTAAAAAAANQTAIMAATIGFKAAQFYITATPTQKAAAPFVSDAAAAANAMCAAAAAAAERALAEVKSSQQFTASMAANVTAASNATNSSVAAPAATTAAAAPAATTAAAAPAATTATTDAAAPAATTAAAAPAATTATTDAAAPAATTAATDTAAPAATTAAAAPAATTATTDAATPAATTATTDAAAPAATTAAAAPAATTATTS